MAARHAHAPLLALLCVASLLVLCCSQGAGEHVEDVDCDASLGLVLQAASFNKHA